jgi:peptide-methionine (R)-S-oxide reductase
MNPVLTRFSVFVATSTLVVASCTLHATGQDSPRKSNQAGADDSRTAPAKTGSGNETAGDASAGIDTGAVKDADGKADPKAKSKSKPEEEFVRKTDAEWRKVLTKTQYMVTRLKATEPAFSGKYATGHFRGTFLCVCCDAELFGAASKFESGTGWPSFDRPATAKSIARAMDYGGLEPRVEVTCRRCGAHLGHVFDDGPTVTGLRFCINSAAIKLKPPDGESSSSKGSNRSTSKASAKGRAKAKSTSKSKARAKPALPSNGSRESTDSPDSPGASQNSDPGANRSKAQAANPPSDPTP